MHRLLMVGTALGVLLFAWPSLAQIQQTTNNGTGNSNVRTDNSNSNTVSNTSNPVVNANPTTTLSTSTSVTTQNRTDVDAEPAYAPNVNLTSSNCIGSWGGSAGGGGIFSIGFGKTEGNEDCFKLEAAKALREMGRTDEAYRLITSIGYINEALNPPPRKVLVPKQVGLGKPEGKTYIRMKPSPWFPIEYDYPN